MAECRVCKASFRALSKRHFYCSKPCQDKDRLARRNERNRLERIAPEERPCVVCGKIFTRTDPRRVMCSSRCISALGRARDRDLAHGRTMPFGLAYDPWARSRDAATFGMSNCCPLDTLPDTWAERVTYGRYV